MIRLISSIFRITSVLVTKNFDKDKARKKRKEEILNEAKEGIRRKDLSTLNRVAYRLKRMRNEKS